MIPLLDSGGGPLYGLSANVAPPPLAAMLSIAMLLGVDAIGVMALRGVRIGNFEKRPWLRWQAPVVGAALLASVLYPVALIGWFPRIVAGPLALVVALAGMTHIWRTAKPEWLQAAVLFRRQAGNDISDILFWLILAGLGLLALGPVTEADSLDYHVGVALSILNTGIFPFTPEWFHSRLAGSGEVLIALGLSIGAEQFGSLLQYSGVLGIAGIFRHGFMPSDPAMRDPTDQWRRIITLVAVSSPVFLAWVASPKPMLLPVAMTTAALALTVSILAVNRKGAEFSRPRNAFALTCLLVMAASVMKMNFLMSGAIVGFAAFGYMIRHRQTVPALTLGIIGVLLIMAPPVVWKHIHFGGSLIDALLTPFPGRWPGTEAFEKALRTYRDTQVYFPLSLILPSGPGTATTTLGLGLAISAAALWAPKNSQTVIFVASAAFVAVLGTVLGQKNARFFLEPYLWLLMATAIQWRPSSARVVRWVSGAIVIQSILVLAMIGVGIVTLTPGAVSAALRDETMNRHANGHATMRWVDSVLPRDAHLIVEPRSIALAPRFVISNDWRNYVSFGTKEAQIYTDTIKEQRPDFMLIRVGLGERPILSDCVQEEYAGPFRTEEATRNPFNSGIRYDAWILRIDSSKPLRCQ